MTKKYNTIIFTFAGCHNNGNSIGNICSVSNCIYVENLILSQYSNMEISYWAYLTYQQISTRISENWYVRPK